MKNTDPDRSFRFVCAIALASQIGIAVTGAAVRLTGSGLGCSSWPTCEPGKFVAPWSLHPQIEFINRLITAAVSISAVLLLVVALRRRPRQRRFVVFGGALVGGVAAQALVGAMVTKSDLLPNWVIVHYLLSAVLVAVAAWCWADSRELGRSPGLNRREMGTEWRVALGLGLLAVLATGPLVTGSGPHAGDEKATRMGFHLQSITRVHSASVWIFVAVVLGLMWTLRHDRGGPAFERTYHLAIAVVVQGGLGYLQYATQLPPLLVGAHVAGSMAVVVATINVIHGGIRARRAEDEPAVTPAPAAAAELSVSR